MFGGRLTQVYDRLAELGAWQRRGVLCLLGALTVLALPPANLWPIAFLTLPPLVWILETATGRRAAFGTGWWFAFGYFTTGLYWISNALLVFSGDFWWMVPFALVGLPAALALFYGLAMLVPYMLAGTGTDARLSRVLALAGAFGAADLVRGTVFTGFPWNTFGYLWSGTESLSQGASVIGIYGLGVLVLVSGLLPALALSRKAGRIACATAIAIPAFCCVGGAIRLASAPDLALQQADETRPGLRLVQANIPQREKWPRQLRTRNFEMHLNASSEDRPEWVKTVIWPETAAAFTIQQAEDYRRSAGAYAIPADGHLITGTLRLFPEQRRLHNSVVVLDRFGTILESYDKSHLVPFGEYVPFADYLPIDKITAGAIDFSPGGGPKTLHIGDLPPFSVLICYEVIFPGAIMDRNDRPEWLLNATNDAWYGETAGPYQHLQHARMRAVEEGLPLVRPANTGISVAFDGYGRELGRIPLEEAGVLDFRLPGSLPATLYTLVGDWIAIFAMLLLVTFARWVTPR